MVACSMEVGWAILPVPVWVLTGRVETTGAGGRSTLVGGLDTLRAGGDGQDCPSYGVVGRPFQAVPERVLTGEC